MGTTFLDDMEKIMIKELTKYPNISTNKLFEILKENYGYRSKKTFNKKLERLETDGFVIRSKKKGKGFKRFIELKPLVKDVEKSIKQFEKHLKLILKLVEYKLKHDKKWDPIKESVEMINKRLIRNLLANKVLFTSNVRRYIFQNYYENVDKFFTDLSRLLWKKKYFKKLV